MWILGIKIFIRHWENKNYTPIVKKLIEEKIKTIDLRIDDLELFIEKIDTTGEVISFL